MAEVAGGCWRPPPSDPREGSRTPAPAYPFRVGHVTLVRRSVVSARVAALGALALSIASGWAVAQDAPLTAEPDVPARLRGAAVATHGGIRFRTRAGLTSLAQDRYGVRLWVEITNTRSDAAQIACQPIALTGQLGTLRRGRLRWDGGSFGTGSPRWVGWERDRVQLLRLADTLTVSQTWPEPGAGYSDALTRGQALRLWPHADAICLGARVRDPGDGEIATITVTIPESSASSPAIVIAPPLTQRFVSAAP